MFKLELYDRLGQKLNIGDFVKVSNGKEFTFFSEVKWLEAQKVLTPFHTFSFHSFEKIDAIPDGAEKSLNEDYDIWYTNSPELDPIESANQFNEYLMSWRECERLIEKNCFRIELIKQLELF